MAAVEFAVVALIDLPLFLATHNPDKVSGTFGENAYQLVIFLLIVAAVLAGIYTFEPKRYGRPPRPTVLREPCS